MRPSCEPFLIKTSVKVLSAPTVFKRLQSRYIYGTAVVYASPQMGGDEPGIPLQGVPSVAPPIVNVLDLPTGSEHRFRRH
jgi:hypothetical protein